MLNECLVIINTLNPYKALPLFATRFIACWGHPSPFHTALFLLNWYKIPRVGDVLYRLIWMKFIIMFSMCNLVHTGIFIEEFCSFNTKSHCSDVCWYHRCPQTLAGICRNICICCGFRARASREKYPGFILYIKKKLQATYRGYPAKRALPAMLMHGR